MCFHFVEMIRQVTKHAFKTFYLIFFCFHVFPFLYVQIIKQKLEYYLQKYFEMKEDKYCQIISTIEASQIQPDAGVENGPFKNIMIECRICLEEYGPFIIPCKCDGTMRHVHENCLKKWAAERLKKQAQSDEQKAKAKLSNIHGIECELCKQNISMEVRKLKRLVGCSEAKQSSEEYFLPFVPLVVFNVSIFLGCLGGAIYIISFFLMLALFKNQIGYEKYSENIMMIWSLLALGITFCVIFMVKSIIQLYYIFVREEYQIIKVIPNLVIMITLPKVPQTDCPNTQFFSNLEPFSTPTSPHSVADQLLQSKSSLTRKNIQLKREIARQIAERKRAKLKQFKANDSKDVKPSESKTDPVQTTAQTSVTNIMVKGIKSHK